jgi:hypothetical protein
MPILSRLLRTFEPYQDEFNGRDIKNANHSQVFAKVQRFLYNLDPPR